jgi:Zn-dependent protease with chaperone function
MNESKGTRFQRSQRRAQALVVASAGAALVIVGVSPLSRWLVSFAEANAAGLPGILSPIAALLLYTAAVALLCEVGSFPARVVAPRSGDRGGEHPPVEAILAARLHVLPVVLPAVVAAAGAVWIGTQLSQNWWWAIAGALMGGGLVAALRGAPAIVARLVHTEPVTRPGLRSHLETLARRAGVTVASIDEVRSTDAASITALVSGMGRARRVYLSAEVVRDWSDDEIAVVVAHELAHHAHHDLARTLGIDAALIAVSLAAADVAVRLSAPVTGLAPWELAALPLIAAVAGAVWVLLTPIRLAESRRQERLADAFALVLTGGADAFGMALRRLGARRLAEERPSIWTQWMYHRHPPVMERLAMAETYKEASPGRSGSSFEPTITRR